MSDSRPHPVWEAEMLTDVMLGIYTRWTHWSDGSVTEEKIPKGPIITPPILWWDV